MPSLYHQYYDRIYAGKDYRAEVATILQVAASLGIDTPRRVFDVGCGTGEHALLLADAGCDVTGIDIDAESIAVAQSKCAGRSGSTPRFLCRDVALLEDGEFDLAVSMFNVVNYIDSPRALGGFFSDIAKRLAPAGVYVFDCWNGVAALLDPPRDKDTQVVCGEEHISVSTRPAIDLMNQSVRVSNEVTVTAPDGTTSSFSYDYTSTLWTPTCLRHALTEAGLDVVNVCQWMQPDNPADENSWKVMFLCRRPAPSA